MVALGKSLQKWPKSHKCSRLERRDINVVTCTPIVRNPWNLPRASDKGILLEIANFHSQHFTTYVITNLMLTISRNVSYFSYVASDAYCKLNELESLTVHYFSCTVRFKILCWELFHQFRCTREYFATRKFNLGSVMHVNASPLRHLKKSPRWCEVKSKWTIKCESRSKLQKFVV